MQERILAYSGSCHLGPKFVYGGIEIRSLEVNKNKLRFTICSNKSQHGDN